MDRCILHCDINNCYATIEKILNPDLMGKPIAVCGDSKIRHGVVLAKSDEAKAMGVKTGEVIWKAKSKCRDLIIVKPHYNEYIKYSKLCKKIYYEFTNLVESFGIDEAWLDCSGSKYLFGEAEEIAGSIMERVKKELGITLSIGIGFNKFIAKMGSNMAKTSSIVLLNRDNYKDLLYNLDVGEMFGVGNSTALKFKQYGIRTIGDLANTSISFVESLLGKNGVMLYNYANGKDDSEVSDMLKKREIKSIGRGKTFEKDLSDINDIKANVSRLCYLVSEELVKNELKASCMEVSLRDINLKWHNFSKTNNFATASTTIIEENIMEIISRVINKIGKVRAISVRVSKFKNKNFNIQSFMCDIDGKDINAVETVDDIMINVNKKYGTGKLIKASQLKNEQKVDEFVPFSSYETK